MESGRLHGASSINHLGDTHIIKLSDTVTAFLRYNY